MAERYYPLGVQSFEDIIRNNFYYVDKTEQLYRLVKANKFVFLSRPRRFGKSLMINTLKSYFQGRKDLFSGLKIEKLEQDWIEYPVIHLDMSGSCENRLDLLHINLNAKLKSQEEKYGIKVSDVDRMGYGTRLSNIIKTANNVAGQQVVLLIDEYDAPMQDNLTYPIALQEVRTIMLDLYGVIKEYSPIIKFVMLTGITKFAQMSIFSKLNNITDISMDPRYETLCGITQEEMETYFSEGLNELAKAKNETREETISHIKQMYDGYHFTEALTDIYNPYSLIHVLASRRYDNFWFASGTPTMLLRMMQKFDFPITELDDIETDVSRFEKPMEQMNDVVPLLYQSGYITIKDYEPEFDTYVLGIPNEEVRKGLAVSLYEYYKPSGYGVRDTLAAAYRKLYRGGTLDDFMLSLRQFYSTIPYNLDNKNEKHYQALFYAAMKSIGAKVDAEKCTANGRIDVVLYMPKEIYIFEFKYQKNLEDALDQLIRKDYKTFFADDPRPVVQIGLNVSPDARTIDSWEKL